MSTPLMRLLTVVTPQIVLADLKQRLSTTRWPEKETVDNWSQSGPLRIIQHLCQYSHDRYDWRKCEERVNQIWCYMATVDGEVIHFLHSRSRHVNAPQICLLHGWPGSVLEFKTLIGSLSDLEAHGGETEDAYHLVIPSIPGYDSSSKAKVPGTNFARIARLYASLMEMLGYTRWVAPGENWRADICAFLASDGPLKALAGIQPERPFLRCRARIPQVWYS